MGNRPFEKSYLVVSKEFGVGKVSYVDCPSSCFQFKFESRVSPLTYYDDLDDILTIRTPRKGSKEARDIVAMLARELHDLRLSHHKYCRSKGWNHRFKIMEKQHEPTIELRNRFEKAKSMLK